MSQQHTKQAWRSRTLLLSFSLVFSFVIGNIFSYFLFSYFRPNQKLTGVVDSLDTLRIGRYGLINPLLDYVTPGNADFPELRPLKDKTKQQISLEMNMGNANDVAVYFRNLQNGHWFGINENEKFFPASLSKVPVAMAYLKLAETQPDILRQRLTYDGSYDLNALEIFKPPKTIEVGKSYNVDDLIRFMLKYSDNNATALLYSHIDRGLINDVYMTLNVPIPIEPTSTDSTGFLSPKQYSIFFRVLYNATYLNTDMSERTLGYLPYNDFPQGLQLGIPENITVADKYGEYLLSDGTRELHDCGIVYHPRENYFICIMTRGSDVLKLANIISKVGISVYHAVDNQYSK